FRFVKSLAGFCCRNKSIIAIIYQTTGKNPILSFGQPKFYRNTLMFQQTCTVGPSAELLFEQHIVYKIQIYLLGEIEYGALHEIRGIERYVQMPVKTERFGVKRSKSQIDTLFTRYLQSIHKIIFIESRTYTGQRTDKFISEQRDIILINIHIL